MTRSTRAVLVAVAALFCAPPLMADGPPPKEKKRAPVKKVYKEEDLRRGGTVSVGTPAEEASPAPDASPAAEGATTEGAAAAKPAEPTEEERRDTLRKELQGKIDAEREKIRELQKRIDEMQAQLNDLTSLTFSSPGDGNDPRTAMMREVEEAGRKIKAAQEAIEALEAQARRQGLRVS
jgi:hypothetical protein